jgi:outer membrane beta-barrel protein
MLLLDPAASVATEARAPASAPPAAVATPAPQEVIREPAPRPQPAARVQPRFAEKAHRWQLFVGAEYLSRNDFYNSPGMRLGAAYYPVESLGVELQLSHFWSSLDATAEDVVQNLGAVPNSRPPTWLGLAGARYSVGYGKILVAGLVLHLEPQVFAHAGIHDYGGDVQPTGDVGLGLLVFLTSHLFVRIDVAMTVDREVRSDQPVMVIGSLPALVVGGLL